MQSRRHFIKSIAGTAAYISIGSVGIDAFASGIPSEGKIPPQALDVEESVLGALMLEKHALTTITDILKPESFYKEAHQKIYQAILTLDSKSQPIDLLTVANQLRTDGELEAVGGAFYLTELTTHINSAANIEFHARIILEKAIQRGMNFAKEYNNLSIKPIGEHFGG